MMVAGAVLGCAGALGNHWLAAQVDSQQCARPARKAGPSGSCPALFHLSLVLTPTPTHSLCYVCLSILTRAGPVLRLANVQPRYRQHHAHRARSAVSLPLTRQVSNYDGQAHVHTSVTSPGHVARVSLPDRR